MEYRDYERRRAIIIGDPFMSRHLIHDVVCATLIDHDYIELREDDEPNKTPFPIHGKDPNKVFGKGKKRW